MFETDCYDENNGISKNVTFVIARAQKSSKFTGFPNLVLSYELYLLVSESNDHVFNCEWLRNSVKLKIVKELYNKVGWGKCEREFA